MFLIRNLFFRAVMTTVIFFLKFLGCPGHDRGLCPTQIAKLPRTSKNRTQASISETSHQKNIYSEAKIYTL
jgi:hypothetical protein